MSFQGLGRLRTLTYCIIPDKRTPPPNKRPVFLVGYPINWLEKNNEIYSPVLNITRPFCLLKFCTQVRSLWSGSFNRKLVVLKSRKKHVFLLDYFPGQTERDKTRMNSRRSQPDNCTTRRCVSDLDVGRDLHTTPLDAKPMPVQCRSSLTTVAQH